MSGDERVFPLEITFTNDKMVAANAVQEKGLTVPVSTA